MTEYISFFSKITLIVIFSLSVFGKLRDFKSFQAAITSFKISPRSWSKVIASIFLITEFLILVLAFLTNNLLNLSLTMASILLAIFTFGITIVLLRKMSVACNCFGPSEKKISGYDVFRNIALIVIFIAGKTSIDYGINNISITEKIILGLFSLIVIALMTNIHDIVDIFINAPVKIT